MKLIVAITALFLAQANADELRLDCRGVSAEDQVGIKITSPGPRAEIEMVGRNGSSYSGSMDVEVLKSDDGRIVSYINPGNGFRLTILDSERGLSYDGPTQVLVEGDFFNRSMPYNRTFIYPRWLSCNQ